LTVAGRIVRSGSAASRDAATLALMSSGMPAVSRCLAVISRLMTVFLLAGGGRSGGDDKGDGGGKLPLLEDVLDPLVRVDPDGGRLSGGRGRGSAAVAAASRAWRFPG
jgi:hypothetical protein